MGSPSWAQVAEASAAKPPPEPSPPAADDSDVALEVGAVIIHPAFGRCEVQRLESDEFAHIRLKNGRLVRLSLDVVQLTYGGVENGRKVFRAKVDG